MTWRTVTRSLDGVIPHRTPTPRSPCPRSPRHRPRSTRTAPESQNEPVTDGVPMGGVTSPGPAKAPDSAEAPDSAKAPDSATGRGAGGVSAGTGSTPALVGATGTRRAPTRQPTAGASPTTGPESGHEEASGGVHEAGTGVTAILRRRIGSGVAERRLVDQGSGKRQSGQR